MLEEPIVATPSLEGLKVEFSLKNGCKAGLFKRPISTRLAFIDTVQAKNAALAACTVKYLIPEIDEVTIEKGLSKAWLPARFEILAIALTHINKFQNKKQLFFLLVQMIRTQPL